MQNTKTDFPMVKRNAEEMFNRLDLNGVTVNSLVVDGEFTTTSSFLANFTLKCKNVIYSEQF